MIAELNLVKAIDEKWASINDMINHEVENKTAYDINEFCMQQAVVYPEKFLSADVLVSVKNHAYNAGLTLTEYMKAVAVLVRDRYFEEHDINVADNS